MARPRTHALIAGALAAGIWRVTRQPWPALAAVAGGFLVDGDHLVDFALVRLTRNRNWFVVPLHGWEFLPLLALAVRRSSFGGVIAGYALGLTSHLIADQAANGVGRWGYFLLYRLAKRFQADRIGKSEAPHAWVDEPIWRWF